MSHYLDRVIPVQQFSHFSNNIRLKKYSHDLLTGGRETWEQSANRVATHVFRPIKPPQVYPQVVEKMICARDFIPGGRYMASTGREFHQTQNCLLLKAQDSREGWAELLYKCSMALMTGAGIGVVYSYVRSKGKLIRRTGGKATGPIALAQMINDAGRQIRQGGERRSAIWAGLHWWHEDIFEFIEIKNWQKEVRELKAKNYSFPAILDGTNISVILDREFFIAFEDQWHPKHAHAQQVYWRTVKQMVSTAEPGFSIDFEDPNECLRNACTEVTSDTTDDICNLGSINMANVNSLDQMKELVHYGCAFLLAGTVYSHTPYAQVDMVRSLKRRLGLGLMGLHEWLIKRGKKYGPDKELEEYLKIYARSTEIAGDLADDFELSRPIKTRAIAPTGTIAIVAETTSGIEPIFCVAYKRRYLKTQDVFSYEYVVDPTAKRLIAQGVDPNTIEDAYTISAERRVEFQAWVQQFVDHGISSTINTPRWGSEKINDGNFHEFGEMLYGYLPRLRGITCYPDGAREGQPLTAVPYEEAAKSLGIVHEEQGDVCVIGKGGSCGD